MTDAVTSGNRRPLCILMVNNLYAPRQVGGAEKSVQLLAESLVSAGHSVHVLTLSEPEAESIPLRTLNGVHIHECAIRNIHWPFGAKTPSATQRMKFHLIDVDNDGYDSIFDDLIKIVRPDVVHTHNLAGFSTRIWSSAKRQGIPVVHTLRDYYLTCPTLTRYRKGKNCSRTCVRCTAFSFFRSRASANVDAAVGISDFILRAHTSRQFFPAANMVRVIPNSPEKISAVRKKFDPINPTLGFIGTLSPSKGIELLISSFVKHAPKSATLVIAGKGPHEYEKKLMNLATHPGIRFAGFVKPELFFSQIDILLVPSLWNEPFSRVALDATSLGVPVIAAASGGLPDVAKQGLHRIFNPDSPPELDKILQELYRNASSFSWTSACPDSSFENPTQAYEKLYGEVIAKSLCKSRRC